MAHFELLVAALDFSHVENAFPNQLLSLEEATWLPELAHHFNERQLWNAIDAGKLEAEKIGKALYVTRSGISRWREASKVNRSRSAPIMESPTIPSKALASQAAARQAFALLRTPKG